MTLRAMIEPDHPHMSIVRQCELLGFASLDFLLSALRRERREPGVETLHSVPISRARARHPRQSQTCATFDAQDGPEIRASSAGNERAASRAQGVSLPAARCEGERAGSRLEHRHHVHPGAGRLGVSCGSDGLGDAIRVQLGGLQHHGSELLLGGAQACLERKETAHLQQRPGCSVYEPAVCIGARGSRNPGEHGRKGKMPGQRVGGAAVAERQVRGGLSQRVRGRALSMAWTGALLRLLQLQETSPITELPNSG